MPRAVAPEPDSDDRFFWDGVVAGKLLVRQCRGCGWLQHPPSPMCPACGALEWDVQELSGAGVLCSWIVSHHPSEPDAAARIVVLVDLEEGVRMASNLIDVAPGSIENGMAVRVDFVDVDGVRLPQFRPERGAA